MVKLVVDASVARACGDEKAVHPIPIQCRNFLQTMLDSQHELVMTTEIKEEWNKHQSSFARKWRVKMVAKKQFAFVSISETDAEIWEPIEAMAKSDKERAAMTKDILLLEAAPADRWRMLG